MAWIKISGEEAKNHPLWDKFCWVRVLFLSVSLVVFIVLLNVFPLEYYRTLSIVFDGYERSYWDLSEAISDTLFQGVVVWLWLLMVYQIIYNVYYAFNYKDIHSSIAFVLLVPSSIVTIILIVATIINSVSDEGELIFLAVV